MSTVARRILQVVSPRHRRWKALVDSLQLERGAILDSDLQLGGDEFLICGFPRSGTALLTALLFQPPDVVAVMEPWDAMRLPPRQLFDSLRAEISAGQLKRGRLDLTALRECAAVEWCGDGATSAAISPHATTQYGVKFPTFWQLLDRIPDARFLVCVRHPYDVITSFSKQSGSLSAGLEYDIPFNQALNEKLVRATSDPETRRILLYELIAQGIAAAMDRSNVLIVRYESWVDEPEAQWDRICRHLNVSLALPRDLLQVRPDNLDPTRAEFMRVWGSRLPTAQAIGYSL